MYPSHEGDNNARWLSPETVLEIAGVLMIPCTIFVPRNEEVHQINCEHKVQIGYDTEFPKRCCWFSIREFQNILFRNGDIITLHSKHYYPFSSTEIDNIARDGLEAVNELMKDFGMYLNS